MSRLLRVERDRSSWACGSYRPEKQRARQANLASQRLKTARAWRLKEAFRWFCWLPDRESAEAYFSDWYAWAIRSRLAPVKKVVRMLKAHLEGVLNFFDHYLTNGPMEGSNNKIQSLIKKAYGYRNKEGFKTDVLFHLGGLDRYPTQ